LLYTLLLIASSFPLEALSPTSRGGHQKLVVSQQVGDLENQHAKITFLSGEFGSF